MIKRFMDIGISSVFLIVFSPVYLITAILIWMQDGHSPIYAHNRVGLYQNLFRFYKFRTMVVDADEILFNSPELYKQIRSGANKIKDDPRVTQIGKFIRKYSIDEFPQMFNVLKGDMSVIGPRALRPDEFELYKKKSKENAERLKLLTSIRPGITGYWQVYGRSNVDFDKRIDMDCYYAKSHSLLLDFIIILKTPLAVIKAEGAY